jgi:hypothetical protein
MNVITSVDLIWGLKFVGGGAASALVDSTSSCLYTFQLLLLLLYNTSEENHMLTSVQHRRTRRGGVVKIVKENYLRDDIVCGAALCSSCSDVSPPFVRIHTKHKKLCLAKVFVTVFFFVAQMLARASAALPPSVSVSIGTLPLDKSSDVEYIIPGLFGVCRVRARAFRHSITRRSLIITIHHHHIHTHRFNSDIESNRFSGT